MSIKFPLSHPIHLGRDAQANAATVEYKKDAKSLSFLLQRDGVSVYSMTKSELYWHPQQKNSLVFKVFPLFVGAQQNLGVHKTHQLQYYTYQFSEQSAKRLKDSIFQQFFIKNNALFKTYLKNRKKLLIGVHTDEEAKKVFRSRYNQGKLQLPIDWGQKIGQLNRGDTLQCRCYFKADKPMDLSKYLIDPILPIAILKSLVNSRNARQINNSILNRFKATQKDDLYLSIDTKKLQVDQELRFFITGENAKTLSKIKKLGNHFEIEDPVEKRLDKNDSPFKAAMWQPEMNASITNLPELQKKQVYLALAVTHAKDAKGSYFVPGLITYFDDPTNNKVFRQALYKGINLVDSNPQMEGKQAHTFSLVPEQFKEGSISVFQSTAKGYSHIRSNLVLEIKTIYGTKETYVLKKDQHNQFPYRIYLTNTATSISIGVQTKSNPLRYELQSFKWFNKNQKSLRQFLQQSEHFFYLTNVKLLVKPNFSYEENDIEKKISLQDALVWIEGSKEGKEFALHKGALKSGQIDISSFLNLTTGYSSNVVCSMHLGDVSHGHHVFLSNPVFKVDLSKNKKAIQDLIRKQQLANDNNYEHILPYNVSFQSLKLRFKIQAKDLPLLVAKGLRLSVKDGLNVSQGKTNDQGELILLKYKPIQKSKLEFRIPAQSLGTHWIPKQVLKTKDGLLNEYHIKAEDLNNRFKIYFTFFYRQKAQSGTAYQDEAVQNIQGELWAEYKKQPANIREKVSSAKTDSSGKIGFAVDLKAMGRHKIFKLYVKLKTNNQKVGSIDKYPGDWSSQRLHDENKKLPAGEFAEKNVHKGLIGTASNPFKFKLNHQFTEEVKFRNPTHLDSNALAIIPPGLFVSFIGQRTGLNYGFGTTGKKSKIKYELFNPSPEEPVYLSLGNHQSTQHQFSIRNSSSALYNIGDVVIEEKGAVRSNPEVLTAGQFEHNKGFIFESRRYNLHVLFAMKTLYEVHTWTAIMSQKNIKKWDSNNGINLKSNAKETKYSSKNETIYLSRKNAWSRITIAHEFGHHVHFKTIKFTEHPYIKKHHTHLITNKYEAFEEGWAEFFGEIFTDKVPAWHDKYRKLPYPATFMAEKKGNGKNKKVTIDSEKGLGSKVEGAVAILLVVAFQTIVFYRETDRISAGWIGLFNYNTLDVKKHHIFNAPKHHKDYQYWKDETSLKRFSKLIWQSFLESQNNSISFTKALLKHANNLEENFLTSILVSLNLES